MTFEEFATLNAEYLHLISAFYYALLGCHYTDNVDKLIDCLQEFIRNEREAMERVMNVGER